ncbi:MAG: DNA-binding response regulator [Candidatus Cloacimonadota bacterium]|nr:MAG: DNA-binding response regulator [Candidatus Cloacimonadota bacterium]
MLRTIIIDDEKIARNRMKRLLTGFGDKIKIIDEAENGKEAVSKINELKPDLIFLDIQMPGLNGFEVLENLVFRPQIIFVTAYDNYAIRAFEENSADYLLKPVTPERLEKAILKAEKTQNPEIKNKIDQILTAITNKRRKLAVKTQDKIIFVEYEKITCIRAEEKYARVYSPPKSRLISKTLNELERELPENFIRIHRSSIINTDFLKEIKIAFTDYYAVLQDGTKLKISRRAKDKLLR